MALALLLVFSIAMLAARHREEGFANPIMPRGTPPLLSPPQVLTVPPVQAATPVPVKIARPVPPARKAPPPAPPLSQGPFRQGPPRQEGLSLHPGHMVGSSRAETARKIAVTMDRVIGLVRHVPAFMAQQGIPPDDLFAGADRPRRAAYETLLHLASMP